MDEKTFKATVDYRTTKGKDKLATVTVKAISAQEAERKAAGLIRDNGQRQCADILSVELKELKKRGPKPGFRRSMTATMTGGKQKITDLMRRPTNLHQEPVYAGFHAPKKTGFVRRFFGSILGN